MSMFEWINFAQIADHRGKLVAIEQHKNIPFEIKRVYYSFDMDPAFPRGFHAHHQLTQVAVCLSGSCRMLFDDGVKREETLLDSKCRGLLIPPMIWHEMHDFSVDCVFLVLASEHYDESDYIRSYDEFKRLTVK